MSQWLESTFKLRELGTTARTELIAGITTFLTMAYIIVVNPLVLGDGGVPADGALFATVMVAGISSILMGLYANLPIALAPGMGLNAFFAYTLVLGQGLTWQEALGAVFVSGIVFILLSLPGLNVRVAIVKAVPAGIRPGVAAGIGLFLALIGMINAGVIVASPATVVSFGGWSPLFVLFIIGLVVAGWLLVRKVHGALLIAIVVTTVAAIIFQSIGWIENTVFYPSSIVSLPSLETFLALDLGGVFTAGILAPVFALLFTDMFDSISTFVGVTKVAGLQEPDGTPKNVGKAMLVDGVSTTLSGIVGSSSGTSYIESAAGVNAGGRSGLTAVVVGLLFLPFMFFSPLLGLIPSVATAPVLVMVGLFMMGALRDLDWADYDNAIPAFVALIAIPFSYSITTGIVLGFIVYVLLKILTGKVAQVGPVLWVIFLLSIVLLVV
ncbi:MAG TPA: NCS2 family permease [Trueperaceae bacterium]|nr:NCS2 family permease [Trueperaceae bacterium]